MSREGSPDIATASPEEQKIPAGPLDVMLIYHQVESGTYHAALYLEHPAPGPPVLFHKMETVRLQSHMHHTEGAPTLEGAQAHIAELREKIPINDLNVETGRALPWNGQEGDVMILPNWRKQGEERPVGQCLPLPRE